MQEIIQPVPVALLREELEHIRFIRPTCKAGNLIYDFTAHEAPNLMREVGRLREIAFRQGGGGTGLALDIDEMDTMAEPYHQLIVWDPEHEAIVGGYRWIDCNKVVLSEAGQPIMSSSHLFRYTDLFLSDIFHRTVELGRAFVQPAYQTREMGSRSLFALDNLWDGLGAISHICHADFFLGKVTLYPSYDLRCRELIYSYLERHNCGHEHLAAAYHPVQIPEELRTEFSSILNASSQSEDFKILLNTIRSWDNTIPPLFSAYLHLCPTLRCFGTAINDEFGDVYETGILVPLAEIDPAKYQRHITSYSEYLDSKE